MKINQQQFKITNKTNKQSLPTVQSNNIDLSSVYTCNCHCGKRLITLSQQVTRMNNQISMIFQLIKISTQNTHKNQVKIHFNSVSQSNCMKIQQESMLLDGIQSQVMMKQQSQSSNRKRQNNAIGKQVATLIQKIEQMEQKYLNIAKMKKNFSLLTKIVEQISSKIQNSTKRFRLQHNSQTLKDKSIINQNLEYDNKKTAQATKNSTKNKQKSSSCHALISSTPSQIQTIIMKNEKGECKIKAISHMRHD